MQFIHPQASAAKSYHDQVDGRIPISSSGHISRIQQPFGSDHKLTDAVKSSQVGDGSEPQRDKRFEREKAARSANQSQQSRGTRGSSLPRQDLMLEQESLKSAPYSHVLR